MKRSAEEIAAELRLVEADRQRAIAGMYLSIAEMERRQAFWHGVGIVVAGILVMLGSRERS